MKQKQSLKGKKQQKKDKPVLSLKATNVIIAKLNYVNKQLEDELERRKQPGYVDDFDSSDPKAVKERKKINSDAIRASKELLRMSKKYTYSNHH